MHLFHFHVYGTHTHNQQQVFPAPERCSLHHFRVAASWVASRCFYVDAWHGEGLVVRGGMMMGRCVMHTHVRQGAMGWQACTLSLHFVPSSHFALALPLPLPLPLPPLNSHSPPPTHNPAHQVMPWSLWQTYSTTSHCIRPPCGLFAHFALALPLPLPPLQLPLLPRPHTNTNTTNPCITIR